MVMGPEQQVRAEQQRDCEEPGCILIPMVMRRDDRLTLGYRPISIVVDVVVIVSITRIVLVRPIERAVIGSNGSIIPILARIVIEWKILVGFGVVIGWIEMAVPVTTDMIIVMVIVGEIHLVSITG